MSAAEAGRIHELLKAESKSGGRSRRLSLTKPATPSESAQPSCAQMMTRALLVTSLSHPPSAEPHRLVRPISETTTPASAGLISRRVVRVRVKKGYTKAPSAEPSDFW